MMKKKNFRKNLMKKAVSAACISALLVAGIPSGTAFAADDASGAQTVISTQEDLTMPHVAEDCMQKIFEYLIKEDSAWSKEKKEAKEWYGEQVKYSESINGNIITLSAEGTGDFAEATGSWNYSLEGDYLTCSITNNDFIGIMYFDYLMQAAFDYLGMDSDLAAGYINATGAKNIENKYYIVDEDASGTPTKLSIYVGEAYQMDEVLSTVYIDKAALTDVTAFDEDQKMSSSRFGKLRWYFSGTKYSADIYIGEHDALTELAYKSLMETVKVLQPLGYEDFVANYKELSEASTETYQVSYVTDQTELSETVGESADTHYKYIKVHFETPEPPSLFSDSISIKAGESDWISVMNGEVTKWTSSNKKVATVDSNGQVTGLKKGTATITATCSDGTKLTCKVTVTTNPTIKIGGKAYKKNQTYTVKKGKTLKAVITGKADSVNNAYTTSKKKVAKITSKKTDTTVKIKGVKKGTSKITVKVNGVSFTFKVKVK